MLKIDGVPTKEQVVSKFPNEALLERPKAITECYEKIPCNPCSTVCPFDAIYIGEDINELPQVDFDKCTGCGICVYNCPGLAIFTVQVKGDKAIFKIPYEFLPYPEAGETYHGVNRHGEVICNVKILKVAIRDKQDKTALVTVEVDKEQIHDFITIRSIS